MNTQPKTENDDGLQTFELEDGITFTEGDAWFANVPLQDPDGNVTHSTGRNVTQISHTLFAVEVFNDGTGTNETLVDGRCFHNIDEDLREQLEGLR